MSIVAGPALLWFLAVALGGLGTGLLFDAASGLNWGLFTLGAALGLLFCARVTSTPVRASLPLLVLAAAYAGAATITAAPAAHAVICVIVAALLAMGSASVVSSVAQVNDRATSELMIDLHAALEQDDDLGLALLRVRQAARGDRVRVATAAAFLGMGA